MFNWTTTPDYTKPHPRVVPADPSVTAPYSVGISHDGRTQMFVGNSILTMSAVDVLRLIRQLEATLPKDTE